MYPESLQHYISEHAVKPPEEFLEHLRALDFQVPQLPSALPRLLRLLSDGEIPPEDSDNLITDQVTPASPDSDGHDAEGGPRTT